jgi:hypothetical protein
MPYEFPDTETLIRYLAMIREVLLDTRLRAYSKDPQIAELLDVLENVPDLLARWSDMNTAIVEGQLEAYERKYLDGNARYTGILRHGPSPHWQMRWPPAAQTRLQRRQPDLEADVTFLATSAGGRSSAARSGYRPAHLVTEDYLTTGVHEYVGADEANPGETVRARITFLSPEVYPRSLWVGKIIVVQEGGHVVGSAKVVEILNEVLRRTG